MVIRYIGIFHSALKGHPMKALLFSVLLLLPGLFAEAAEKPDFSDIESMPIERNAVCQTTEVTTDHHCTIYCANEKCDEGNMIVWEGDKEIYLYKRYKDGHPGELLWSRAAEPKVEMTTDQLLDALQEHGQIIMRKSCTDSNGNEGFTCVFIELGEDRYVLAFDKQGAAFLFLETEGNAENTLLWRRGLAI